MKLSFELLITVSSDSKCMKSIVFDVYSDDPWEQNASLRVSIQVHIKVIGFVDAKELDGGE